MDIVSFFQTIRRHLVITIIGVVLTILVTGAVASQVQPTYVTAGSIELVPPNTQPGDNGGKPVAVNPSQGISQSLQSYALILAGIVNGPAVQDTMSKQSLATSYSVSVAPVGTVLDISAKAATVARAESAYEFLAKEISDNNVSNQQQTSPQLSKSQYITTLELPGRQTKPSTSARTRTAGGVFVLGLIATIATVFLVDWIGGRRRRRQSAAGRRIAPVQPRTGTVEIEPPDEQSAATTGEAPRQWPARPSTLADDQPRPFPESPPPKSDIPRVWPPRPSAADEPRDEDGPGLAANS